MKGTIHIFGYGEAQIISKDLSFKTSIGRFTKLQAVIDDIKSKKPINKIASDYHAINIFGELKVNYIAKLLPNVKIKDRENSNFSFDISEINTTKLNELIIEFTSLSKE